MGKFYDQLLNNIFELKPPDPWSWNAMTLKDYLHFSFLHTPEMTHSRHHRKGPVWQEQSQMSIWEATHYSPSPNLLLFKKFNFLKEITQKLMIFETFPCVGKIPWRREQLAIRSSFLVWRIPWTEEPGRLQSMGSQRVGYNWTTFIFFSWDIFTKYSQPSYCLYDQNNWQHFVLCCIFTLVTCEL